jgi:hypothetical protein
MFSVTTILTFLFGLFGQISNFIEKDKRPKLYRIIIIVIATAFVITFWIEKYNATKDLSSAQLADSISTTRAESLQTRVVALQTSMDSLQTHSIALRNGQDSLIRLLHPFMKIAEAKYPTLRSDTALEMLAATLPYLLVGVGRLQQKLVRLRDRTVIRYDNKNKLFHTIYRFRSQSGYLRDIRIEMVFDDSLKDVQHEIAGAAISLESGSRKTITDNKKGFIFETSELSPSNDLLIDVMSWRKIQILKESLAP